MTVGGVALAAKWENAADGGAGMYHGSVAFGSNTGTVVVTVVRNGATILQMNGRPITPGCPNGIQNWNAWVGQASTGTVVAIQPAVPVGCVEGTGMKFFWQRLLWH